MGDDGWFSPAGWSRVIASDHHHLGRDNSAAVRALTAMITRRERVHTGPSCRVDGTAAVRLARELKVMAFTKSEAVLTRLKRHRMGRLKLEQKPGLLIHMTRECRASFVLVIEPGHPSPDVQRGEQCRPLTAPSRDLASLWLRGQSRGLWSVTSLFLRSPLRPGSLEVHPVCRLVGPV